MSLRGWAVRPKNDGDREWLAALLRTEWGGDSLIVRGVEQPVLALPALIAGERDGVAIYQYGSDNQPAELLLLHALRARTGIGSALLAAVVSDVRARGANELRVATTNDNIPALQFYQKLGFRLHALRVDGVAIARRMKPSIPLLGFDDIPMRDEIDLILTL
jgi:GNAT superfamily N-acetyltransferase